MTKLHPSPALHPLHLVQRHARPNPVFQQKTRWRGVVAAHPLGVHHPVVLTDILADRDSLADSSIAANTPRCHHLAQNPQGRYGCHHHRQVAVVACLVGLALDRVPAGVLQHPEQGP